MSLFRPDCPDLSHLMTKQTKWHVRQAKTQVSLGIRPFWSEYSPCAQWVAKDPSFLHEDSEDSDQTGRTCHFVCFVMRRLISVRTFHLISPRAVHYPWTWWSRYSQPRSTWWLSRSLSLWSCDPSCRSDKSTKSCITYLSPRPVPSFPLPMPVAPRPWPLSLPYVCVTIWSATACSELLEPVPGLDSTPCATNIKNNRTRIPKERYFIFRFSLGTAEIHRTSWLKVPICWRHGSTLIPIFTVNSNSKLDSII